MASASSANLTWQSDPLGARQSGGPEGPQSSAAEAMWPGMQFAQQAFDYWTDACQRSVLFLDVVRQRGNIYFERADEQVPTSCTSSSNPS